jgi:hypothetical protein
MEIKEGLPLWYKKQITKLCMMDVTERILNAEAEPDLTTGQYIAIQKAVEKMADVMFKDLIGGEK